MAFTRGAATKVMYGAFDLSAYFRDFDHPNDVDVEDSTTFGKSAKTYIPTLTDSTLSLEGLWDGSTDAVDAVLAPVLGGAANPLTIGVGGLAHGTVVKLTDALEVKYQVKAGVGGLVEVSAEFQANEGGASGFSLHDLVPETTTGNTASVDYGAASAGGGVAHLHVSASSGTAPLLAAKVQHSVDDSTFADLITFGASGGGSGERVTVGGTVNRYVRLLFAITGTTPSLTFTAAFARL
jgi:hypothetical protein